MYYLYILSEASGKLAAFWLPKLTLLAIRKKQKRTKETNKKYILYKIALFSPIN